MIFELALLMYLITVWYIYNNFPELVLTYSSVFPVVALVCYYLVASITS
jgi:hypothetical protein